MSLPIKWRIVNCGASVLLALGTSVEAAGRRCRGGGRSEERSENPRTEIGDAKKKKKSWQQTSKERPRKGKGETEEVETFGKKRSKEREKSQRERGIVSRRGETDG